MSATKSNKQVVTALAVFWNIDLFNEQFIALLATSAHREEGKNACYILTLGRVINGYGGFRCDGAKKKKTDLLALFKDPSTKRRWLCFTRGRIGADVGKSTKGLHVRKCTFPSAVDAKRIAYHVA